MDLTVDLARERTEMTVHPDGWVDVVIGTSSQGQGHETSFAQLVNEWLDVPIDNVRFITHDSDVLTFGGGAHSGRGMRLASQIMWKATNDIIARGKRVAALLLQGKPEAIAFQQEVMSRMKLEGCDAVILGCTEIPLIMNDTNSPLPTLDSTRLIARAALRRAVEPAAAAA